MTSHANISYTIASISFIFMLLSIINFKENEGFKNIRLTSLFNMIISSFIMMMSIIFILRVSRESINIVIHNERRHAHYQGELDQLENN